MDDLKEALEAVELLTVMMPHRVGEPVKKENLVLHGEMLWPHTYKGAKDDWEMEENFQRHISMLKLVNPMEGLFYQESLKIPDNKIILPGAARWYGLGMPTYRLTKETLLRLAKIDLVHADLACVEPPFSAFYVDFPADTILVEDFDRVLLPSPGMLVHVTELFADCTRSDGVFFEKGKRWNYAILTDTPTIQWQYNRTLDNLLDFYSDGEERNHYYNFINKKTGERIPLNDYDRMLNRMVSRMIVGLCHLARDDGYWVKTLELAKFPKDFKRTQTGSRSQRIFTERAHDEKPAEATGE